LKASSTSSKATALISTPLPNAMMSPSGLSPIRHRSASAPPTISDEAARKPQPNDSSMSPGASTG
jgi:hypothetical protein